MKDLVYPRERTLGTITLVLGLLAWLVLIIGTFGFALLYLAIGYVVYLFTHSALIAHIKGNAVELSETQFPDLHAQFVACCDRLQIKQRPQAYVLNGNGALNAFATKFLGTQFVVLMSDVVDAMEQHADGVRFYIGHELGHLRMKHLTAQLFRWPVLWLPLLGAAYSRARESTCDRHGLACCDSPEGAARALAALSAGVRRWKSLDISAYLAQAAHTSGFWMSFHELLAAYPWLTKRVARVFSQDAPVPKRHGLAYALALFVPYAGRLGGGFGFLIMVYIIGVLAAVAIPGYQDYVGKAKALAAVTNSQPARDALATYYVSHKHVPATLADAHVPEALPDGSKLSLDPRRMVLTVSMRSGGIVFIPFVNEDGKIAWNCRGSGGMKTILLPASCREKMPRSN